jgi:hypothetical protein
MQLRMGASWRSEGAIDWVRDDWVRTDSATNDFTAFETTSFTIIKTTKITNFRHATISISIGISTSIIISIIRSVLRPWPHHVYCDTTIHSQHRPSIRLGRVTTG